ncbi:MAG: hypothetical protein OXI54_11530 [Chloroflexota bacterium]|nr:hypothetical protein [Chloroflexota bacterium]MDE2684761.1 hypothetical protein [Chloroflexota bacterium]
MDFWSTNWGDIATAVGIFVSFGGLIWAIKEARGARSASQAAQTAARETRDQITRHLQTVDLERAIGLIQLVKTLHDNNQWEAAREHYQTLREMLTGIIARCPEQQTEFREKLATARTEIRLMEDFVRQNIVQGIEEAVRSRLNEALNGIQSDLEELASAMGFDNSQGEKQ